MQSSLTCYVTMMTSSNGNIFRVTGLCAGNLLVTGEFPAQRPVTRSFHVFFHLCLIKRSSKQSWGWWFEMPSRSLWRHSNNLAVLPFCKIQRVGTSAGGYMYFDSFLFLVYQLVNCPHFSVMMYFHSGWYGTILWNNIWCLVKNIFQA